MLAAGKKSEEARNDINFVNANINPQRAHSEADSGPRARRLFDVNEIKCENHICIISESSSHPHGTRRSGVHENSKLDLKTLLKDFD